MAIIASPETQGGCAVVCGTAPSVFEDYEAAMALRPDAVVLGASTSPQFIERISHLWTQHGDEADRLREVCGRHVWVHSRQGKIKAQRNESNADFIWPSLNWVGGSSGFAAALWAAHGFGYDEVILAGVPLSTDTLSYAKGHVAVQGVGTWTHKASTTRNWQAQVLGFRERGLCKRIRSMSGWTRGALGAPGSVPLVGEGREPSLSADPAAAVPAN